MATWLRLQPPSQDRQSGIRGYRDVLYYGTKDLETEAFTDISGSSYTITESKVAAIEDNIPITDGQPHPDPGMAGAICVSKRLLAGPTNGCAIVAAYFDSTITFGGGPSRIELKYEYDSEPLYAPQANMLLYSASPGPPPPDGSAWGKYSIVWTKVHDRQVITITERRLVATTADEEYLATTIAVNYGKAYVFGGLPVILASAINRRIRDGYYDITYVYKSKARVQGRNVGPENPGFLLNVPALDWFEEWQVDQTGDVTKIHAAYGFATITPGSILP